MEAKTSRLGFWGMNLVIGAVAGALSYAGYAVWSGLDPSGGLTISGAILALLGGVAAGAIGRRFQGDRRIEATGIGIALAGGAIAGLIGYRVGFTLDYVLAYVWYILWAILNGEQPLS